MQFSAMERIFEPTIRWAHRRDRLVSRSSADYSIDVFDAGAHARTIRRDLPAREASEALAMQQIGESMEITLGNGQIRVCESAEVVEQRGFAPTIPHVQRMVVGPGRLWVMRTTLGEDVPTPVDVFTHAGEYLGTLRRLSLPGHWRRQWA